MRENSKQSVLQVTRDPFCFTLSLLAFIIKKNQSQDFESWLSCDRWEKFTLLLIMSTPRSSSREMLSTLFPWLTLCCSPPGKGLSSARIALVIVAVLLISSIIVAAMTRHRWDIRQQWIHISLILLIINVLFLSSWQVKGYQTKWTCLTSLSRCRLWTFKHYKNLHFITSKL